MANYSVSITGQSMDNLQIVGVYHEASPVTRPLVYEFVIGSDDDAANAANYLIDYCTTTPTEGSGSTNVSASKGNPDSVAADAQGASGTTLVTSASTLMQFGLNQRVSFRWVARQGKEFTFGATVAHGIHLQGGNITTGFDVSATIFFEE